MKGKKTLKMRLRQILPNKGSDLTKVEYCGYPVVFSPKNVALNGDILASSYEAVDGDGKRSYIIAVDDLFLKAPEEVRMYSLHYECMKIKSGEKLCSTWSFIDAVNSSFLKLESKTNLDKGIELIVKNYPIDDKLKSILKRSIRR